MTPDKMYVPLDMVIQYSFSAKLARRNFQLCLEPGMGFRSGRGEGQPRGAVLGMFTNRLICLYWCYRKITGP